jgi:hypothetical protein
LQPTVVEKAAGVVPASFANRQFFGIDHFWPTARSSRW